ncbi:serine hydrolase domain-containing protein [Nonomuraea ferruginea]|uniref:Serine hydrolase n=1 Tax=Nonomuraea ferruginea TaxID=46174 RepID=A0ABT4TAP3_9ACTN|nr:serine hydrolase domain-containing protein [Nonomuraea ferruginea]MDA0646440.1 serine hydrolase [Nonomuraea ferruginea]
MSQHPARILAASALATLAGLGLTAPVAHAAPADPVQKRLDTLVQESSFPGAIAAVRGRDGRTRTYTAGVADLKTEAKMPADARVRIASNTKMFTAVVALQLAGEGKLDLDAPIEKYLPGVVRGKGVDGRKITTRRLLQHTSGLRDYDDVLIGDFFSVLERHFEPRELVDTALARRDSPAKGWDYSNTNYILAGLVVQKVTGRPIGEEITRRVIKPLGLRDTYWPGVGERDIRGPHPKGYLALKPGDPYRDVTRLDPSMAWAAGALVATPKDLNTFMTALMNGELLRPAQLKQMKKTVAAPEFDTVGGARYGLGIATFKLSCGGFAWSHGGSAPGYATGNGVTEDGRAATVAVTSLPSDLPAVKNLEAALDTALCA